MSAHRSGFVVARSVVRLAPFVVGCAALWWVSSQERPPLPSSLGFLHSDKLLHALAYLLLAVLASLRRVGLAVAHRTRDLVEPWTLAALYGVVDELHQTFTPGRTATVSDAVADATGALVGALLARAWRTRLRAALPAALRDDER